MRIGTGRRLLVAGLCAAFMLAGCMPVLQEQIAATAEANAAAEPSPTAVNGAVATVATRSLRVRESPSLGSPQVGSILNGESFKVTGRSSDGHWFELEIPSLANGSGWVSTELVSVSGAIIDLPIFDVSTLPTLTPTPLVASVILPTPTPAPDSPATATPTAPAAPPALEPLPTATPTTAAAPVEAAPIGAAPVEGSPVAASPALTATATLIPVTPPAAGLAAINADVRLRVRAEPSADAPIVGFAYRGEVFPVLESSADGTWTKIGGSAEARENAGGGWVATEFLLIGQ